MENSKEQILPKEKQRVVFLDFLRVVACFMVIVVHACECYYFDENGMNFNMGEGYLFWVSVIDSGLRPAVPLFIMASSYLLLPLTTSSETFFKRRFKRVFVPFIIWSLLYVLIPWIVGQASAEVSQQRLIRLLYNFNDNAGHLWFIYMLIGAYLTMPVISPWLKTVSRRGEECFLAVWFVSTWMPYLHLYPGEVFGECYWNQYHALYYYSGFIGYLVLAHYIRTYINLSTIKSVVIGATLYIIGYIPSSVIFYKICSAEVPPVEGVAEVSWDFCSPNVAAMTIGLFLCFKAIKSAPEWLYRPIRSISELSYGMYLMHMFFLNIFAAMWVGHGIVPITILSMAFCTYMIIWGISKLLSMLPFGRYIVG